MMHILPYIEQTGADDMFDYDYNFLANHNYPALEQQITAYLCPSDDAVGGPTGLTSDALVQRAV